MILYKNSLLPYLQKWRNINSSTFNRSLELSNGCINDQIGRYEVEFLIFQTDVLFFFFRFPKSAMRQPAQNCPIKAGSSTSAVSYPLTISKPRQWSRSWKNSAGNTYQLLPSKVITARRWDHNKNQVDSY